MLASFSKRDRDSLYGEARDAGVEILASTAHQVGTHGAREQAKQVLSLVVKGEATSRITHVEVVELDAPIGPFLYVVPFENASALAGVYHFRLAGGFAEPAVYVRRFFGARWHANDNKAASARIDAAPGMKAAVKELPFRKGTSLGDIVLDYTAQFTSLGDGTTHLAIQAGSRNLDTSYQCLVPAVGVARALAPILIDTAPLQGFYFEPPFLELVYSMMSG
ncbi:MAG: hypothetical protein ACKV2T_37065 [Kofleriaceae bacterium]